MTLEQQFLELLEKALELPPTENTYHVLVSGGIDSSVIATIAKERSSNIVLYTIQGQKTGDKTNISSPDVKAAEGLAHHLKLPLHTITFSKASLEAELPKIVTTLKEVAFPGGLKPLDILIATPLYFGCRYLSKTGVKHVFTGGGGPDEILGGYKRHETTLLEKGKAEVEYLIAEDVKMTIPRNIMRDSAIAKSFNIDLHLPYMDSQVKNFLEELPLNLKITQQGGKIIRKKFLRVMGETLRLPQALVDRPKKAFQYGSNTHRLLERKEIQRLLESFPPDDSSKT
ncbi:MAG: asparagine synthase C-terminal domain-containing protein [Candidatus Ranarchaeia archaeon]|jgi:asparagine synthase (glutamine-hydrolysing)